MESLILIFARSQTIGGALIRFFTRSQWSHVGIVDGRDVIEAVAGDGVRKTPLREFQARYVRTCMVMFPVRSARVALEFARSQMGRPYDWTWILGFVMRRQWDDEDSWVCCELAAAAIERSGPPLFRHSAMRRVTQEHLWMLPNSCPSM